MSRRPLDLPPMDPSPTGERTPADPGDDYPAAFPGRPAAPNDADARDPGVLAFIKDNLEAFAVAVIMALVIKHFCVEAFKIPTGSMVPTLHGDNYNSDTDGDRILVDKWAYLFSSPQRWHIPVFRYPLNRSRNFIKRIIGLPGEYVRIYRGDIWIKKPGEDTFRIARKPTRVREHLYFPVYPPIGNDEDDAALRESIDETWRIDGPDGAWRQDYHERFHFIGGPRATLVTQQAIRAGSSPFTWPPSYGSDDPVRDVRIRATIERGPPRAATPDGVDDGEDEVTLTWQPDSEWEAVVVLSAHQGGSHAELRRGGRGYKHHPLAVTLGPRSKVDVTLEYVDGDLRVAIDGDEQCVLSDDRLISDEPDEAGQGLRVSAVGSPSFVDHLTIERDLFYENSFAYRPEWQREGLQVPEGAYFMLGDNTASSSDSRKWRIRTIYLRDGTEISFDDGPSDGPKWLDNNMKRVVDVEGVTRTWREDDEDPDRGSTAQNAPFVWRKLIVGRAFLVFWPLGPTFPGRLRFIH